LCDFCIFLQLQFTLQLVQSVNHCNIHLNTAAVGTHHEVYLELHKL